MDAILSWNNVKFLFQGLQVTLEVAFFSIILSFIIGLLLGVVRFSKVPVLSQLAMLYTQIIRNLPLLLIIFFVYSYTKDIGLRIPLTVSVITSMTIFTSALVAEIVRSGLNAVPKGLVEASRSQGMTYFQTMYHVILPLAFKKTIPPLVSQFVSLIKDTSLAVGISLPELMHNAQIIYNKDFHLIIPMLLIVALIYFVINYSLSLASRRLEKKLA